MTLSFHSVNFNLGMNLKWKHEYSFFVRAWFSDMSYKLFKSPGVKILPLPPATSQMRGASVKEVIGASFKDVDYVNETNQVKADWSHKFTGDDIMKFHLYLSTVPGGRFCLIFTTHFHLKHVRQPC